MMQARRETSVSLRGDAAIASRCVRVYAQLITRFRQADRLRTIARHRIPLLPPSSCCHRAAMHHAKRLTWDLAVLQSP